MEVVLFIGKTAPGGRGLAFPGGECILGSVLAHVAREPQRTGPGARRLCGGSSAAQLCPNGLPELTLGNNFKSPSSSYKCRN